MDIMQVVQDVIGAAVANAGEDNDVTEQHVFSAIQSVVNGGGDNSAQGSRKRKREKENPSPRHVEETVDHFHAIASLCYRKDDLARRAADAAAAAAAAAAHDDLGSGSLWDELETLESEVGAMHKKHCSGVGVGVGVDDADADADFPEWIERIFEGM